jgi:hypothetical protein
MTSEIPELQPEYGVLRPTIRGGEPDRMEFYPHKHMNTRAQAEKEVASWRARGERAYVIVKEIKLLDEASNHPHQSTPYYDTLCAWCDDYSRGSGFFPGGGGEGRWFASCGRILHGFAFEPTQRWRQT